jgi:uncharacterized membrane protein YdjX (TVP38/TMEM64 family)
MILVGTVATLAVGAVALWFALPDRTLREAFTLYGDPALLRETLRSFGPFAPVVFIVIQALQVVIAPVPGDLTGLLGGFVFGEAVGFLYSTIGLTTGSLVAFWTGRCLGRPFVERTAGPAVWAKIGFLVETEGSILCFFIYLIPGLPKDLVCYLFGLSPMSFWVFALASTLGRMPGTWVLSAQGAKVATGDYGQLLLLTGLVVAVALPLYCYRSKILVAVGRRRRWSISR